MAIYVYIINDQEKKLYTIGSLDMLDIFSLVEEATKKKLKYLSFIDFVGYTIFNNEQIQEIKEELKYLSNNRLSFEILTKAVAQATENSNYYIMFEGE